MSNLTTTVAPLATLSLSTLSGVNLISTILVSNQSSLRVYRVVDVGADLNNFLYLGIPFFIIWCVGIAFVSYHTDDDGYVIGARKIESEFVWYRYMSTFFTYFIEAVQLVAAAFGPDSVHYLPGGQKALSILGVWLFRGGDFFAAFPAVVVVQLVMILLLAVPAVLWKVLDRDVYDNFAKLYVTGPFGPLISFVQDCYLFYLTIPFMIVLFTPAVCVWYATGEPASALVDQFVCGGATHQKYLIIGVLTGVIAFAMGIMAGTIPVLVKRSTDIALNGRFTAVSFAIKCMIAVSYVLFADRHAFFHAGSVFFLQCVLVFLNITLRPCLVERINFHRSAGYVFALAPTVMLLASAGMADSTAALPPTLGIAAASTIAALIIFKYFLLSSGKLFPAIDYNDGSYEGGICLGLALPHGYGIWRQDTLMFAGRFLFGKYHGYGVVTSGQTFFQGIYNFGVREGFGVTNDMVNEGELSYEGEWLNDTFHGLGTKRFTDRDAYEGQFVDGIEHGEGTWTFNTTLESHPTYVASGTFNTGIFTNVQLEEHEKYTGELRYGVPHGMGVMKVDDDVFEGEWRAGKLHGHGKVKILSAGEYEGELIEGHFNQFGTWRDDHETYSGNWRDGLKHGQGVQELESGSYDGQFVEGERHGYGTFTYKDGTVYQGSWQHNDYHGAGLLKTSDGAEYDGNWNQGRRHGTRGCITFPSGESYVGGWNEDEYHEHGKLKIPDMGEYNGRFEFGKRHGLGRFTFNDGSEYIGEWAEDFAGGEGHFVFSNRKALMILQLMTMEDAEALQLAGARYFLDFGGVYDGSMAAGAMHGQGTVVCGDGTTYKGDWEAGLPHGSGVLMYPGGGQYVGDFFAGLRDGIGTMTYADARLYRGAWEQGKRHGHGVLFSAEGDILHDCEWVNDIPSDEIGDGDAIHDIPVVDVDELLRAIMPQHSTVVELEEARARKRMEVEQLCESLAIKIWVEQELGFTRLVKAHFGWMERGPRKTMELHEMDEFRVTFKPILVKVLNQWKAEFRVEYERDPKKSDILRDPFIAPIYISYQDIAKS